MSNEQAQQQQNPQPGRAKTFDELDVSEQIQKLRQVCLQQADQINGLHRLITNLMSHQHVDGRIVVPLFNEHGASDAAGSRIPYPLR